MLGINPDKDGVDHINVYSKGKTELGRLLTNFAKTPFVHPKYGEFSSIEALWYWLSCKEDKLRPLHGFQAKKVGRECGGEDWVDDEEFKKTIIEGIACKLEQNPDILKLLKNNTLPLKHYYNYNGKVVEPKNGKWVLDYLETYCGDPEEYIIDSKESAEEFLDFASSIPVSEQVSLKDNVITIGSYGKFEVEKEYGYVLDRWRDTSPIKKNYKIVTNIELFNEFNSYIDKHGLLAFDTETTGLNVRKDRVIGFSISGKSGDGYYYPMYTWNKEERALNPVEPNLSKAKSVLSKLCNKKLITWNGSFDTRVVKNNLGINLINSIYIDGMLLKHLLQEEGPFGLKPTGIELQSEIGLDVEEEANKEQIELKENIETNGGSATKSNYEMHKADLDVLGKYAAADADLTYRIVEYYTKELERQDLTEFFFEEEVMPLYKEVTIPMEDNGVSLDMPLLESTKEEIENDIKKLEGSIVEELFKLDDVYDWYTNSVEASIDETPRGKYAQGVVEFFKLDLPKTASGKYSTSKKNIEQLQDSEAKEFFLGNINGFNQEVQFSIKEKIYLKENEGKKINISSKKQMSEVVFDYMGIKPLSKTDKGSPQFNDKMIEWLEDNDHKWAKLLHDYNKLIKIRGAYVDRFLDNNEDGKYYFSYKQHGTISGRYGSDAQQLPRPLEEGQESELVTKYTNRIRRFFISEEGRIFIDSDYESLEPHVFAHVSGDPGLISIFNKGHDFYSTIAIATEKLEGVSADKKADNYLGKVDKQKRQLAKAYALGVPYGMGPYALGKTLGIETEDAEDLIDGYLSAYPKLKEWMDSSKEMAQKEGHVRSEAGRIRHLPKVKEIYKRHKDNLMDFKYRARLNKKFGKEVVLEKYRDYKNGINNSRNYQIQSMSSSIVNRAAIAVNREFKKRDIGGWCCAQIHDQLIADVPLDRSKEAKEIMKYCMENTTKLSLDLKAPPELAINWNEGH